MEQLQIVLFSPPVPPVVVTVGTGLRCVGAPLADDEVDVTGVANDAARLRIISAPML